MAMNVTSAVRFYVDKIVSDPKISGMKVLLLDAVTTQVVAMVYSQSQILEKEVYLVERMDADHEPMQHLKAVYFIRPTKENIQTLCAEISKPRFLEYHVFFCSICPNELLQQLAAADEHEVVRQVHEYYAEFCAVNEDFFSANCPDTLQLALPRPPAAAKKLLSRNRDAVLSVLLALKKKPSTIRYAGSSSTARELAMDISAQIQADQIFDFRRQQGPVLLILDRRDDPVTPLLSQWTYQAMVHELLGLNDNRVVLKGAPGVRKDLEEVVLSCTQDDFFAKNRFSNFGDLGVAVKNLMDEYQKATRLNENINSIEDMQAFLERYPAFRSQSLNVSKHVAVLSELARLVDVYHLLDVSQFEQELACADDHVLHYRELMEKLTSSRIKAPDKLRLAMLYALRYEDMGNLRAVKSRLLDSGLTPEKVDLLDALLQYSGNAARGPGLFGQDNLMSKLGKQITTTLQGVENVYAQHVPLMMTAVEAALKGKLKDSVYPAVGPSGGKSQEVIVFMVGGVTYEEACKVAELNASLPSGNVVLGGSFVHNSTSFLEELNLSFGPASQERGLGAFR
ncbi:conserved unknown protein [Ectocarpus siliculosus]|uniref:Uncharacterized protein n=1 Tax=Ectocarpus siliculosus TaxID=2880 RepID=D7FJK3_ECTSI|nr:conserved unknown protein [Ectocarpus siliculosus]|eukprot:CBJ29106.1 conserved unknown protein [Ectocarpus siliculosus]